MTRKFIRFILSASVSSLLLFGAQLSVANFAVAQSTADNSDLVARHQVRLDTVDSELRNLRGVLETDLRSLRIQMDKLAESSEAADLSDVKLRRELKQEIARLDDTIGIMEQRLRRTLELSSDIEFRVIRLEKRMQTLISLNLDDGNVNVGNTGLANSASSGASLGGQSNTASEPRTAQSDTLAGGTAPSVVITRDEATGETVWTVDEDKLNSALQGTETTDADAANADGTETASAVSSEDGNTLGAEGDPIPAATSEEGDATEADDVAVASILPDADPEEQFKFALSRALQREFDVAEQAFEEFRRVNPDHERSVDSLFWLGRVQLMQGQYERSAMTFTTFNSEYPTDARIVETTLFIAESVSQFAEPEQACAIYASLPQLLDAPTENFTKRMGELAASAGCN